MKVGFIGLGNQGAPIARRIARGGYELHVYDHLPAAMDAFDEPGAIRAADAMSLARSVNLLAVCVRTDSDLSALVDGGRLFAALGDGGIFIIHSTVGPGLCRELAALGAEHGVALLDAGVSGGVDVALAGKLLVMVGGDAAAFDRARPVIATYGSAIHHLGPVGRGMEAKLINNLVSIAQYELAAATLEIGGKLGFEREQLRQALLAGSAQSFALQVVPRLLAPDRAAGLQTLLRKDFDHAAELAAGSDVPLGALGPAAEALLDRLGRIAAEPGAA